MNLSQLRNPVLGKQLLKRITQRAKSVVAALGRKPVFMEVCGTHTTAISRCGLHSLLESLVELRSGPGCPVCVTSTADLDQMLALARQPNVMLATFGDLLRVPGSHSSLEQEKAQGARIEVLYSPWEALTLAERHRDQQVVLIGVGFETTAPLVALCVAEAQQRKLTNFSILSLHKTVPPVLHALLSDPELCLDGLLLPGHVCAVTGRQPYDFIASQYGKSAVVTGFEPLDILGAMDHLLEMLQSKEPRVINGYTRVVREVGNPRAQEMIQQYFATGTASWRGFGDIPDSGLYLRAAYKNYDAWTSLASSDASTVVKTGCHCGDVLKGKLMPTGCALFAQACTPAWPQGPCMVSSEGACAAYYQYERASKRKG